MAHALITGASEGIGKALAHCAAKDGYDVTLTARSANKLRDVAADLETQFAIKTSVIIADLSAPGTAAKLWEDATADQPVDVLVNNAGLGLNGAFAETDWAREQDILNVNIVALTELMKLALRDMAPRGKGKILNVASIAATLPGPQMAVYHATKSYVLTLSEAVAEEMSGTRVHVTALCPGATKTDFFDGAEMTSTRLISSGAQATPEDVAVAGWRAMKAGQRRHVPGFMNKLFFTLPRILPRPLIAKVMKRLYARKH